ncbi:uracil-DNA glycosylase family protein [Mangrovimonas spongiae]|uniref:Uracil-DNA glycosylase family protein n=1 Tax=Mangrovimonas spongiae TaxID=2494697 RepID=A0A3R9MD54_9FLAO|nr:uracil-DNA glycosylase family protein [Mangrovimonas spongiae]RSK39226.1 uracil-DNA glycosylase family protein [Mangrovimonas spongiae]
MFIHQHPYKPFIPKDTSKLIVGTLPPPRFTTGDLKPDDVNFCYGSRDGQLWKILNRIFDLNLKFENTEEAVAHRKSFLKAQNIGVCDMVERAKRDKIDASDLGMQHVELRDMINILQQHTTIKTMLFMGGNSKNGPEYFFRRHIKPHEIKLKVVSKEVPRIHQFLLPNTSRIIKTVSLTAPSGSANRAVGSMALYKQLKQRNPNFNTLDFRVMQYTEFFK